MIINNNIPALNTYRQMGANNAAGAKAMEKLSSGLRINRAGDDAAGLAISEKMRAQVRGLDQASRNSQDGISMIQTAEGALQETHNILQRMRELATQAANDTNVEVDRNEIQKEINQLSSEINRIGNTTEFNTQKILNGGIETNGSEKITQATSATIAGSALVMSAASGDTLSGKITVDGRTFDLSTVDFTASSSAAESTVADAIKSATSGGAKLSDYLDVKVNASDELVFTAKSSGSTSTIQFDTVALGTASLIDDTTVKGDPTLVEKVGMQAGSALSAAGTLAVTSSNNTLTVKIGTNSVSDVDVKEVNVKLETGKTYDLATESGRADLINAINGAIQNAGLEGSLTASLSKDNELQLISQTGQDFAVDSNSTLLAGLGDAGDFSANGLTNVNQVVGPGAQGSGFTAKFQIGANQGQSINLNINDMRSAALGITGNAGQSGFTKESSVTNGTNDIKAEAALDVSTHESAAAAIKTINDAIEKVSGERSNLGAIQNRLEHTISNLNNASENLQAAESRIRDVDMAKEVMEMTRANILGQASQAMLAQANQKPQAVLQLLG